MENNFEMKDILKKIESSPEFKKWKSDNDTSYLAHLFTMRTSVETTVWQVGYFNPKSEKMISYVLQDDDSISYFPEQEVFKKPGQDILELKLENVNLSFNDASNKAEKLRQNKYPNKASVKEILILQNLHDAGLVWNVTFFLGSTLTYNVKLNATNSELIFDKEIDLINDVKKGLRGQK